MISTSVSNGIIKKDIILKFKKNIRIKYIFLNFQTIL